MQWNMKQLEAHWRLSAIARPFLLSVSNWPRSYQAKTAARRIRHTPYPRVVDRDDPLASEVREAALRGPAPKKKRFEALNTVFVQSARPRAYTASSCPSA